MTPQTRDRLLMVACLAWAALVLSQYYRQAFSAAAVLRFPPRSAIVGAAGPLVLLAGIVVAIRVLIALGAASASHRLVGPRASCAAVLWGLGLMTIPWFLARDRLGAMLAGVSVGGFPWIGDAAARASVALVGASLVAVAALSAGALVLRLIGWSTTSRAEHVVFAGVTGVTVVSLGSLVLAHVGLYRPLPMAVVIAALIIAGGSGTWLSRTAWLPLGPARTDAATGAWIAIAAAALAFGLVASLAPEIEYDALWYHLQLPRLWLEAGQPVDLVQEYVSLYPLTWELIFGAGMALGGPVAAKLLHFACLPLLALLVAQAARRFLPGVPAALAAALVVTTPTLLWESGTAYVDLALSLHAAAGCYALARYGQEQARGWGIVAGLQLGTAAATKHLGVIVTAIAVAVFVAAAVRHGRRMMPAVRSAVLISLLAAAVPSPWYVRSWLASGNPVFPEMYSMFGASPPERWAAVTERGLAHFKAHFGFGRSPRALLALPWDVTIHGAAFGGSIGPLFLVLLPALVLVRRETPTLGWLAAGVVAYVLVWASPLSSFQIRFLMPIVPALALLAAASAAAIRERAGLAAKHGAGCAAGAFLCLVVLNLPPFVTLHEPDRVGTSGWLTHVLREPPLAVVSGRESEAAYLRRQVPSWAAWRYINSHLAPGARVLTFSGGDHLYSARARISHDATMASPAVWGAAAEDLGAAVDSLRRLGVTHVLYDRRELSRLHAETLAITSPRLEQACTAEYDDRRFWVCRLDFSRLDAARSHNNQ